MTVLTDIGDSVRGGVLAAVEVCRVCVREYRERKRMNAWWISFVSIASEEDRIDD
jgi:hypothetical protein